MIDPLSIAHDERRMIESILRDALPGGTNVWVFGSRALPYAEVSADLDLLVDATRPLTLAERSRLEASFEFSLLPYRVDIVDAQRIRGIFAENVKRSRILLFRAEQCDRLQ